MTQLLLLSSTLHPTIQNLRSYLCTISSLWHNQLTTPQPFLKNWQLFIYLKKSWWFVIKSTQPANASLIACQLNEPSHTKTPPSHKIHSNIIPPQSHAFLQSEAPYLIYTMK